MKDPSGGRAQAGLLFLLACLVALGFWNYTRNLRSDQAVFRPYRSYSQRDLDQLIRAYEADLHQLHARYEAAQRRSIEARGGPLLGERVRAFEQTRRAGERLRTLGGAVSEHEAALRDFEAEKSYREAEKHRLRILLRRLFTVRL